MMSWSSYAQFGLALAFVLALIGGLSLVARRLGYGHAARGPRSRRLALVEVLPLDARRRLVLIRRDQVEHLLLLGPTSEQVVETGIAAIAQGAGAPLTSFASHLPMPTSTPPQAADATGGMPCAAR